MEQGAGPLKTPGATRRIIEALAGQHPNADTELVYRNAFELLVATVLSAQSTDAGVNQATPALFARFPTPRALADADPAEVETLIKRTGFFRQKTKAIMGLSQLLCERHGGTVPADMDALTALPGVGRKTANVVLGHALGVPGLPVDRHVLRVSNRLGIAEGDDPVAVEAQLTAALPPAMWTQASDVLILHGRRVCKPTPLCDQCAARDACAYHAHAEEEAARAPRPRASSARPRATARTSRAKRR